MVRTCFWRGTTASSATKTPTTQWILFLGSKGTKPPHHISKDNQLNLLLLSITSHHPPKQKKKINTEKSLFTDPNKTKQTFFLQRPFTSHLPPFGSITLETSGKCGSSWNKANWMKRQQHGKIMWRYGIQAHRPRGEWKVEGFFIFAKKTTPLKFNIWNLKITCLKRKIIWTKPSWLWVPC